MQIFDFFQSILSNYYFISFLIILSVCILLFSSISNKNKQKRRQQHYLQSSKNQENIHGIIFGKQKQAYIFSPTNDEGHVLVVGGSGSGKTSAVLVPTLQHWTGTSLTIDISGDICKNVHMDNKLIYEPINPDTIPYDVFAPIDRLEDEDSQNEALEQLAFLLMPDDDTMSDSGQFFHTEGRKILTASLIAFYHQEMDFIPICEKIVSSSWQVLFRSIDNTGYQKAIQYINSFEGASQQNTAGCKQACDSVLKLFATNAKIKQAIRRPSEEEESFSPSALEEKNIFLVIPDSKLKLYAPLLHLITSQCMDFFSDRSNDAENTILFCLDEFASLGRMDIIDALRKYRKKHIRIIVLTQSTADIDLIYGKAERSAMLNNFKYKVVLNADDTDTQEYFSKLIGYSITQRNSVSKNSKQTTRTKSDSKEWTVEPSDLARLGNNLILLYPGGYKKLGKNFYYT